MPGPARPGRDQRDDDPDGEGRAPVQPQHVAQTTSQRSPNNSKCENMKISILKKKLEAGGKPSTKFPPEGLSEHIILKSSQFS